MKLDADHDRALRRLRRGDDRAAVVERTQIVHVRQIGARHIQPNRLRAGGEQQRVVRQRLAALDLDLLARGVDAGDAAARTFDAVLAVEILRAQRNPFLRRVPGEIVLREIRAIVRRGVVGVDDRDPAVVSAATQHLRRRAAGRARADDHHVLIDGSRVNEADPDGTSGSRSTLPVTTTFVPRRSVA